MKRQLGLVFLFLVTAPTFAQSEVYVCTDRDGRREYRNTGPTTHCKKVDMSGISTIPSSSATGAVAPRPTAPRATPSASSPPEFPRVDSAQQKARDNDRRQILLDELKLEEGKLATLKSEYNNGEPERRGDERNYAKYLERTALLKDDIARTERNVEALRRELGNLK